MRQVKDSFVQVKKFASSTNACDVAVLEHNMILDGNALEGDGPGDGKSSN